METASAADQRWCVQVVVRASVVAERSDQAETSTLTTTGDAAVDMVMKFWRCLWWVWSVLVWSVLVWSCLSWSVLVWFCQVWSSLVWSGF